MAKKTVESKNRTGPPITKEENGALFPIAAIGASAGGLEAFTTLLKNLPADTGMAFVLIQHLAPDHESALVSLLSKVTPMPVREVEDDTAAEPNRVYIIPPNKSLGIRHGHLRLTPREPGLAGYHPIDDFSMELAQDRQSSAIGVVLSGNGSDGTMGLRAVKAEGGITLAQTPETAQWPGMPLSAIAAGVADVVLPPDRIAKELARIGREPYLIHPAEETGGEDLDGICSLIRTATGIDFRLYKQATVARRVARRMTLRKISSKAKYVKYIHQNPSEARELADDIFIHVTGFFRDPEYFDALRSVLVPRLRNLPPGEPIRVWVPGCSTGEEAYSLAMLLLTEFGDVANGRRVQVFGTDISMPAIESARSGIYSESAIAGLLSQQMSCFYSRADGSYKVSRLVRESCVFARHDLAKDPPFSRLDLISCRNVLIYLGQALQKKVLSSFRYALKPDGLLFLGKSESIAAFSDSFSAEDPKHRIFSRQPGPAPYPGPNTTGGFIEPEVPGRNGAPGVRLEYRKQTEQVLLARYAPPALMVDANLTIVHFQGDTSLYLAPAAGQPSFHLLRMVRAELVVDLRTAIYQAGAEGLPVQVDGVRFEHGGTLAEVGLSVTPLKRSDSSKFDYLIAFEKATAVHPPPASLPTDAETTVAESERLVALERELAANREYRRCLIVEHEKSEEEMRAANEEILSSNEELQSTNEELETATEELQSSNEELITLNEELQNGNLELGTLTSALNSLLVGIDIPVLVLDAELRIQRFTPGAAELFNLIATDVGRPFRQMASNLDVADWDALLEAGQLHPESFARDVKDRTGRWFSLRLHPYKPEGRKVEGLLVVLLDIDAVRRALDEARESAEYARAIVDTIHEPLAVLDTNLQVMTVNASFCILFEVDRAEVEGKLFFSLDGGQWKVTGLPELMGRVVAEHIRIDSFELDLEFPRIGRRRLVLNARESLQSVGRNMMIVVAIEDVTKRKAAEEAAIRSESTVRELIESAAQAVVAVDKGGNIVFLNRMTEVMFGYPRGELLGMSAGVLIPEDRRDHHANLHREYFASSSPHTRMMAIGDNLEGRRKDGSRFPVEISLSVVETKDGRLGISFVTDITERRRLEVLAETNREEIRALAARLLTAQEEERRRVSRELHDDLCQQLALLAFDVGGLAAKPSLRAADRNRLLVLQGRVVKASDEARHIAYRLHPSVLDDLGLSVALRGLVGEFITRAGVKVEFEAGSLPDPLPHDVATSLYRSAQEALTNVARHAKAKLVRVTLQQQDNRIVLSIADDGIAFQPNAVKGGGGLGLVSMEERVRLVNGTLSIESAPGKGTRIVLAVPLPESAQNGEAEDN